MTVYGADTSELRQLAKQLDGAARRLDAGRVQLTQQLRSTRWTGPVATRFVNTWNSEHTNRIATAVSELNRAVTALHANANEQDNASTAAGQAVTTGGATGSNPLDRLGNVVQDVTGRLPGELARIVTGYAEAASPGISGIGKTLGKATGWLGSGYSLMSGMTEHDDLKTLIGGIGLAGSLLPLPLDLVVGPTLLFANMTLPTSNSDVDATVDTGAQHLFGKNADQLSPAQAQQLVDRYEPPLPWGSPT